MLHRWEEPCISGQNGTGAVFFSGCTLSCVFCQNRPISHGGVGKAITVERLREIFQELVDQGADSIDLVSPTPFALAVREALSQPLPVPVVWNAGGYERVETVRAVADRVQVWLPDLKYMDGGLALRYSGAADYPQAATAAILEMHRLAGDYVMGPDGVLKSGVVIRHLLLPGAIENTKAVLDWVASHFRPGQVLFSLMAQYTPQPGAEGLLRRRVTGAELRAAKQYMENLGITDGYVQDLASAQSDYTPAFDLSGIE
jgi:putative pyruvate formate lyase activating enzyme